MLALQRTLFTRSNLGLFLLNRQSFEDYTFLVPENEYNRVFGIDYNLATADNTWTGKFYLHKSFQPGDFKGNLSTEATLSYNTRKYNVTTDFLYIDNDFRSDLGYIPRTDVFKSRNLVGRSFYPKSGIITRHGFQLLTSLYWQPSLDLKKTDHDLEFSWSAYLRDLSTFELRASNQYIFLTRDFDPTRTQGATPLPGNNGYTFNQATILYQSNMAQLFSYNVESTIGQFYNGQNTNLRGTLSFRYQPWVLFSLVFNYSGIRLPEPYSDADIWLLSPKIDITFSKSLFWSTLVQYSNQRENLGLNSRLQWRFAPLSDLYLVYNDNYFTDNFSPRFRSINLKLTYWLNI